MAIKSSKPRKPARTIDEQIADLQAKAEAQKKREIERIAARIEAATEQYEAALGKAEKIKATLRELVEKYDSIVGNDTSRNDESGSGDAQETSGDAQETSGDAQETSGE